MRVICIEDSLWQDGPQIGEISTYKGSIYHVTGSIEGEKLRQMAPHVKYTSGTWYSFLEVPGIHHSVRYLEIPDEEKILQQSEKLINNYQ